jgi:hypothetical protein
MGLDAGFLSMLTMSATWEAQGVADQWGNEEFNEPVTIKCFVTVQRKDWGTEAFQQKHHRQVTTMEIITDAVGITNGDKINIDSKTLWVTNVDTPKDEFGTDLMHTISCTTEREG